MEYKFNEYERIMDSPNKSLEERAIVEKIMYLINSKKYNSFESFCEQNSKLDDFKKRHELNIVLKHFGEKLNQEDYEKILNNIQKLTVQKTSFSTDGIETKDVDDKQFVTYDGKDEKYYFDNSYSFDSFDKQLENLQSQSNEFQTSDTKENTERMMKEMKKTKKISLILRYLNEINYDVINDEQKELFKFAFEYQQKNTGLIRIDLDEKVMVDEDDNIMKIDKVDGNYRINNSDDYKIENNSSIEIESSNEKDNNQLSFTKMPRTQLFKKEE